jgi:pyridoxamine 5'-phosphate oxidase
MNPATLFGHDTDADAAVEDPLDLLDRWLAPVARVRGSDGAPGDDGGADGPGRGGEIDSLSTPLMALATVDEEGDPRVRHVLLSAYERGRLHFHTDARSEKAAQLAAHPRAGATIVWPDIPRQLSLSGGVEVESDPEAAEGFARRTRYLQLLAWVNDADLAQRPAAERRAAWEAYERAHATLEPPPTWIGYALVPTRITFWRGGPEGPSQRVVCHRQPTGWSVQRLPG